MHGSGKAHFLKPRGVYIGRERNLSAAEVHIVELSYFGVVRALMTLLQWVTRGITPIGPLTVLTLAVLGMVAAFGPRMFGRCVGATPWSVLDVLALWAMAC